MLLIMLQVLPMQSAVPKPHLYLDWEAPLTCPSSHALQARFFSDESWSHDTQSWQESYEIDHSVPVSAMSACADMRLCK